jgi:peptidoglycan/xylan/chitin deacetylase (PgdA/CDA1 family)
MATADRACGWLEPTLVLSLDLELAWGSFDHAFGPRLLEMARWTHDQGAPLLLELLARNGLSATWAVVGLVMLDHLPEPLALAPHRTPDGQDWFAHVPPGATEASAPEWFGASLVRRIRAARPRQEIGFHGFSHVILDDPHLSAERAREEIDRCVELARDLGLDVVSFVFPRNGVAQLDRLRAAGVRAFRSRTAPSARLPGAAVRRVWEVGADFLGLRPALVAPHVQGGMVEVPGSLLVRSAAGWRRLIPDAARLRRLRQGLRAVARQGGVLHVWLHPESLYAARPRLEGVLGDFFAEASDLAAASRLRVRTLGELGGDLLAGGGAGPAL